MRTHVTYTVLGVIFGVTACGAAALAIGSYQTNLRIATQLEQQHRQLRDTQEALAMEAYRVGATGRYAHHRAQQDLGPYHPITPGFPTAALTFASIALFSAVCAVWCFVIMRRLTAGSS